MRFWNQLFTAPMSLLPFLCWSSSDREDYKRMCPAARPMTIRILKPRNCYNPDLF